MRGIARLLLLTHFWLVTLACSSVVETFGELNDVRNEVEDRIDAERVQVSLNNGSYLIISLINPGDLPESGDEREAIFVEVIDDLDLDDGIESVTVNVVNQRSFGCFHSSSFVSYGPWAPSAEEDASTAPTGGSAE